MSADYDQHHMLYEGDRINMGSYILSVSATGLLYGILTKLPGTGGATGRLIKLSAGIVLLFAVLQPVSDIKINDPKRWLDSIRQDAMDIVDAGTSKTSSALSDSIKKQAEAYILDKAVSLGVSLEVEIIMSEDALPTPAAAALRGDISPYAKAMLMQFMESELGITGDMQEWNKSQ